MVTKGSFYKERILLFSEIDRNTIEGVKSRIKLSSQGTNKFTSCTFEVIVAYQFEANVSPVAYHFYLNQ